MEREAAFHRRQQARATRPQTVVTVTAPTTPGALEFPPFAPPALLATHRVRWAMLAARALMLVWALVTAWRIHAATDDPVPRSPSGTVTAVGWLVVALWFVAAARWSWLRTTNVHRLEGRYPSRTRAAVVWAYPAVWVLLMGVTLVPASPNPDFDYRPPIIVAGFVLTMVSGYRIVHRIFKSLVRMPPTATCVAFYLVDLMAFGLIWWRVTSWTGRDGVAPLDADLDRGILVAASVALAAGMVITWYLDRAADRGQQIRMLALRTRYDHRMARLNGLDPMNPQTRYALMLARRAAERAAQRPVDERTPDAVGADDPLVAELARELELGITPDFAARVRELERRTDGLVPGRSSHGEPHDEATPAAPPAARLWLAELLRYVVVGVYAACAAACVVLVVAFRRGDTGAVDAMRELLLVGAAGVHVLVALWAIRITVDARRFALPALWRIPAAAFGTAALVVPLWFLVDVGSDAAKFGLFTVLTLGLELALWRVTAIDWLVVYRESDSPLEAWMSVAPFVLGLVLLSPMRGELAPDVSGGRVAFFATLIGLAAALSGGLAAVAMVQLEDALRATTPGDRAPDAADPGAAAADPPVRPAPIERSAGTTRTPTAKPRSEGPPSPIRVDVAGMTAEVAAGLGLPSGGAGDPVTSAAAGQPPTDDPTATAPPERPAATKAPAAKAPAAKKSAAKRSSAKRPAAPEPTGNADGADGAAPGGPEAQADTERVRKTNAAKTTASKKTPANKTAAETTDAETTAADTTPAKKTAAKKTAAKKTAAKTTAAKKTAATRRPSASSEERPLALDAQSDDRGAHEDPADAVHEAEGTADRVGGLGELVDDPDHREQDHDVPQAGDHPDQPSGPGER